MTESTNSSALTAALIAPAAARTRSRRRTFVLHVGEMMAVMFAGMLVLGGVMEGGLALAGTSMTAWSAQVSALVMGFNMVVPMVAWMHYRGHGARDNAEMAASMIVPTGIAIALSLLGLIAEDAVMLVQHVVMIPAMVALMLLRYDHYTHG
jgi:flagellar biosynthetic protein FliP